MGTPRFDPTHSLEFNFDRGTVKLGGQSERVLVPADVLASLLNGADPDTRKTSRNRLGTEAGRRVSERIDATASIPTPWSSTWAASSRSWGSARSVSSAGAARSSSRWSARRCEAKATSSSPASSKARSSALSGARSSVLPLERDDALVRLLVVSKGTAERVRGWLGSGVSFGDALARLNGAGGAS